MIDRIGTLSVGGFSGRQERPEFGTPRIGDGDRTAYARKAAASRVHLDA